MIQETLQQPYDRSRWTSLIHEVFPNVSIYEKPQSSEEKPEWIQEFLQLGNVRLQDGKNLAIFEVRVSDNIQLTRNRVALRDLISRKIDLGSNHGVLCVFNSSTPEYRFTFVAKDVGFDDEGQIQTTETNSKRYTYILGPGETRRTASQRFSELAGRRTEAGIKEIAEAFSVERLNKEFFELYKVHYQAFVDHLIDDTDAPSKVFGITARPGTAGYEDACKPVRDWVKKLLGRIVFIHFIQKKGWMGCKPSSRGWKDGDPRFLANFFEGAKDQNHFYSKRLAPLFFEALNAPDRLGDIFDLTGTKVPYLNGGLFDESDEKASKIDFPARLFKGLIDFFAAYNFTIDENDPEDHEVGIDPEMLGHIFENLLEENKDKGAYYTPKPVVQFMCQQSLLLYLKTHLGDQDGLEKLVRQKDSGDNTKGNWIRQNASRIEELLDKLTICDPAIGSGAFPMGMLQEIFWIKLALDWTLNDPAKYAEIKRRIIEHTIHGVDIDAGAVEIARLRCWLSLVVDEVEPHPLPNLEFKIHCANSLIEYMRGEPVDFLKHETLEPAAQRFINDLELAKTKFFEASRKPEKRAARLAIYRAITELGKIEFTWMRTQEGLFGSGERTVELNSVLKDFNLLSSHLASAEKLPAREQDELLNKTQQWFHDADKPTFAWRIHYAEVFAKNGFDIVIANPPFIKHEKISGYKHLLEKRYILTASRVDLYVYFYELAVKIIKANGVITIISPNKYYRAAYGKKMRVFFTNETSINTLIDFGDAPLFKVISYASIFLAINSKPLKDHKCRVFNWSKDIPIRNINNELESKSFAIAQDSLNADGWLLVNPAKHSLLEKLKSHGISLASFLNNALSRGIITGLNEAFVISKKVKNDLIHQDPKSSELIKPWIRGRDVKPWRLEWSELYVIAFPANFHAKLPEYPAILNHLSKYESELKSRGQCTTSRSGKGIGQHHWLELDNNPKTEFLELFQKPKVLVPAIERQPACVIDKNGFYCNDKITVCTTGEPEFLCALLNSKVIWWYLTQTAASRQNGYYELKPMYLRNVPVPSLQENSKAEIIKISDMLHCSLDETHRLDLCNEMNQIFYAAFKLTPKEISIINAAT